MDLTTQAAKALDLMREAARGTGATINLLDHDSDKGYSLILTLSTGWHAAEGVDPNELIVLKIAESESATASDLEQAQAFSINTKVYRIAQDGRKKPSGTWRRVWTFMLNATGETFEIAGNFRLMADGSIRLIADGSSRRLVAT